MPYSIYIKSFTTAQKAHNFLMKHNIRSMIIRSTSKKYGCGFALKISGADRAEVCALLRKIGVSCDLS